MALKANLSVKILRWFFIMSLLSNVLTKLNTYENHVWLIKNQMIVYLFLQAKCVSKWYFCETNTTGLKQSVPKNFIFPNLFTAESTEWRYIKITTKVIAALNRSLHINWHLINLYLPQWLINLISQNKSQKWKQI